MSDSTKEKLNIDELAELFKNLEDEAMKKMLDRAGVTDEDLENLPAESGDTVGSDSGEAAAPAEAAATVEEDLQSKAAAAIKAAAPAGEGLEPDAEAAAAANKVKAPRKRRKVTLTRRFLFVIIFVGIIGLLAAANKIFMSVSINSNDPIQYAAQSDEISADEGILKVNGVSAKVPVTGKVEYSISYSWSEEDEKYPSVPHAISAIYSDAEGKNLYSISLYRNETITKDKIPSGKKASNWFKDWPADTDSEICQEPLDTANVKGFYIYPHEPDAEGNSVTDYSDFSYYFSVKEGKDISVYVLEGVCLDGESCEALRTIMDECIQSITVE